MARESERARSSSRSARTTSTRPSSSSPSSKARRRRSSRSETAAALVKAAKRAIAREAYRNARKLGLRALELRPTLGARYVAARAAWRLQDWGAVQVEMAKVRDQAREEGERVFEALALTALGEASLKRDGDAAHARTLVDEALEILPRDSDAVAHFDALTARAVVAAWLGSGDDYVRFMERAYVKALDAGRKDLQTIAAQALASAHIIRLELDEAEILLTRALELAGESGSVRARISATLAYAGFLKVKGELDAAETMMEEVRETAEELGMEPVLAAALMKLGWLARAKGRPQGLGEAASARRSASRRRAATAGSSRTTRPRSRRRWPNWARSTRPSGSRSTRALTRSPRTRAARSSPSPRSRSSAPRRGATARPRSCSCRRIALAERVGPRAPRAASARAPDDVPPRPRARRRCGGLRGAARRARSRADVSTERIA